MKGFNCLVVISIILGVTLLACDKIDGIDKIDDPMYPKINDPMYPTTIYRLSEEKILQMRSDFAQRNPDVNVLTTINQFGFCAFGDAGGVNTQPGGFTEQEALAAAKEFVAHNPDYTGVSDPNNLKFRNISSTTNNNNTVFWHFITENQVVNDIEVYNTEIVFHTQNNKLVSCYGNNFPEIYVPENFNFDIERAKLQLLGREVIISGWGGPMNLGKVKAKDLQGSAADLKIVPQISEEKTELRVTWKISVNTMPYVFYVDVMTGEIIAEGATIIA